MLLQTNSYIVPKERRAEHARLIRRFRQALARIGCDQFEVYEQVGANWSPGGANGRYVQIMRFRDRQHQQAVQTAERNDHGAQQIISEFCDLINFPYQQQHGYFATGFYTSVLPTGPKHMVDEEAGEQSEEFTEAAAPSATGDPFFDTNTAEEVEPGNEPEAFPRASEPASQEMAEAPLEVLEPEQELAAIESAVEAPPEERRMEGPQIEQEQALQPQIVELPAEEVAVGEVPVEELPAEEPQLQEKVEEQELAPAEFAALAEELLVDGGEVPSSLGSFLESLNDADLQPEAHDTSPHGRFQEPHLGTPDTGVDEASIPIVPATSVETSEADTIDLSSYASLEIVETIAPPPELAEPAISQHVSETPVEPEPEPALSLSTADAPPEPSAETAAPEPELSAVDSEPAALELAPPQAEPVAAAMERTHDELEIDGLLFDDELPAPTPLHSGANREPHEELLPPILDSLGLDRGTMRNAPPTDDSGLDTLLDDANLLDNVPFPGAMDEPPRLPRREPSASHENNGDKESDLLEFEAMIRQLEEDPSADHSRRGQ